MFCVHKSSAHLSLVAFLFARLPRRSSCVVLLLRRLRVYLDAHRHRDVVAGFSHFSPSSCCVVGCCRVVSCSHNRVEDAPCVPAVPVPPSRCRRLRWSESCHVEERLQPISRLASLCAAARVGHVIPAHDECIRVASGQDVFLELLKVGPPRLSAVWVEVDVYDVQARFWQTDHNIDPPPPCYHTLKPLGEFAWQHHDACHVVVAVVQKAVLLQAWCALWMSSSYVLAVHTSCIIYVSW